MPSHQNSQDIRAWWWNTVHILSEDEHLRQALQQELVGGNLTTQMEHLVQALERIQDFLNLAEEVIQMMGQEQGENLERIKDLLEIFRMLNQSQDKMLKETLRTHDLLLRLITLQERTLDFLNTLSEEQRRSSEHLQRVAEGLVELQNRWNRLMELWQTWLEEGGETPS